MAMMRPARKARQNFFRGIFDPYVVRIKIDALRLQGFDLFLSFFQEFTFFHAAMPVY
jgi:hypothetical protein